MPEPAPAAAAAAGAAGPPDGRLREPEKLTLPAAVVEELVRLALRTEVGAFGWRVFASAHGEPSWLTPGRWRLVAADATLLPAGED